MGNRALGQSLVKTWANVCSIEVCRPARASGMVRVMELPDRRREGGATLARVLAVLRSQETALRSRGILHVGVFGSVARGDDTAASDIDIVIEIDYASGFGTTDLIDVEEQLARALGRRVDVVSAGGLKPGKHDAVRRDAVPVF
jgi:predicted nucleotidyltransferase